ncbi:MAG: hypoxanthine phosphoribosyltransferase [Ezakiella sp.]|nr:hypoxanthine phosphoribosyltransferase [Ezakiella sp.]MDD7471975.1 hypoxanthine phosphoribosyltransferase [Bacillota bacterium]MDY3923939.1 hypoxanthine phosphoribosyltransferase [Ezakiella sp.]
MKRVVLFKEEEIERRVGELADELNKVYSGKEVVVIPLLRGGVVFAMDLVKKFKFPVEMDFLTTSSYGFSDTTSGNVNILNDIRTDVKGKDVLLVDDIIDTGKTLLKVKEFMLSKSPASIKVCTMLDKPSRRVEDIQPDFTGFKVEDLFIVGYGLDYQNFYRNIPYIFVFEKEEGEE